MTPPEPNIPQPYCRRNGDLIRVSLGPPLYGDEPTRLLATARHLLNSLSAGRGLTAAVLRDAMSAAFEGSDAHGAWVWKDAYDAAEAAVVLFIKRYGTVMRREAGSGPQVPAVMLDMLQRVAALEPSHSPGHSSRHTSRHLFGRCSLQRGTFITHCLN